MRLAEVRPKHLLSRWQQYGLVALVSLGAIAATTPMFAQTEVTIQDNLPFPESITSTPDGTLIIGSMTKGNIYRAAPGATTAEIWIPAATSGMGRVEGVLAEAGTNTLWVCSNKPRGTNTPTALKSFDLKSGAAKASYDFPGGDGECNDLAIGPDKAAYVTDTKNGRILRLKPGAPAFEVWVNDPQLASADGICFGDKTTIYVNTWKTGKLFRVRLGKDGAAGPIEPLTTSAPLVHPDGMRPFGKNSFLMAENEGRLDQVTVSGDTATIKILKDGFTGSTAVTQVKNTAWVLEGKQQYLFDPAFKGKDPGPFQIHPVPLDKK